MPMLTSAPSPEKFAKAWSKRFEAAVKEAAGSDGRLSAKEARRVEGPYADNAANYLERTGQKSVSVAKLIGAAERYAYVQADKVDGDDKKLSLADGNKLSRDLRLDFFALRGKEPPQAATPAARRDAIEKLFDTDECSWNIPGGWRVVDLRAESPPAWIAGTDLDKAIAEELAQYVGVISYDSVELFRNPNDGSWLMLYQQDGELFTMAHLFDENGKKVGLLKTYDDGSTSGWL